MTMMIDKQNPVILASASPRRRELIRLLGIPVRSEAAGGSEQITTTCPWEAVEQLSEQKAREIALARAQAGNARIVEMELEEDDGRLLYEGEMRDDANEYEFEIDAYTGTVVKWEAEELGR